jgi:hypothetical protein
VWADSAHRSAEIEASLAERGRKRRIHRHPLARARPRRACVRPSGKHNS